MAKLPSLSSDRWQTRQAGMTCPSDRTHYQYEAPRGTRVDIIPACQLTHQERATGYMVAVSRRGYDAQYAAGSKGATLTTSPRNAYRFPRATSARKAAEQLVETSGRTLDGAGGRRKRRRARR